MKEYICTVCGYIHKTEGELPDDFTCPICGAGKNAFVLKEDYIQWVYVETGNGGARRAFKSGDAPEVTFCVGEDKPIAVYAYCNIHGLWKTEL